MADGYRVDVTGLQQAAFGVSETIDQVDELDLSKIDSDGMWIGHERLAKTLNDFYDRWQLGVEHLVKDGREIAGLLSDCVVAYIAVDDAARDQATGVLQGTEPDPGIPR